VVPLGGAYAASKWALEALAEAIAIEAGHFGVKVTCSNPEPSPQAAANARPRCSATTTRTCRWPVS